MEEVAVDGTVIVLYLAHIVKDSPRQLFPFSCSHVNRAGMQRGSREGHRVDERSYDGSLN